MSNKQEWRLLHIDDDDDDYLLTRSMLSLFQGRKVKLEWAPTYEAGVQQLCEVTYDAVLVDYDLGTRTGIELIRELVAQDYPAPFILYTGRGSYEVDIEAMQAGATLYLTKMEATPLLLERSIRYAIERKQIEGELRANNELLAANSVSLAYELAERQRAEQRLETAHTEVVRERNRLLAVMETLPVGVAIVDPQGGTIQANLAYEQVWGDPRPETQTIDDYNAYKAWWMDTGQPVQPEEWASARAVQNGETVLRQLMQIERFDGSRAFVLNSGAPIHDAQGQIVGSAVAIMDITGHVAEERRREWLRQRRAILFQTSLQVMAEKTLQGLLDKVVEAARSLTGAQVAISGHGFQDGQFIVGASSRVHGAVSCPPAELFHIEQGGVYLELFQGTGVLRLTDEELRRHPAWWGLPEAHCPLRGLLGASTFDAAGHPNGLIMVSNKISDQEQDDFTEDDSFLLKQLAAVASLAMQQLEARQQVEQHTAELQESEERLRLALEIGAIGYAEIDYISGMVTYDPVFQAIWGLGDSPSTLDVIRNMAHPDDQPKIAAARALTFDPKIRAIFSVEYRILRPDGEMRWISTRGRNFFNNETNPPRPVSFIGVVQDITERKQAEVQVHRLNRTLRALSNSNQTLMRATDEPALLQGVCDMIVEDCGHAMAWIGFVEEDEGKTVRPVAYAGFAEGDLETQQFSLADSEHDSDPTGAAICNGDPSFCRNRTGLAFPACCELALRWGYASSIALPLISEGKTFGALTIYSQDADPFSDEEVKLLTELAGDVAFGILSIRLRVANSRIQAELQQQREWLRVTLISIGDGVITTDTGGRVTFLNPVAAALTGWTPGEALGQPVERVFQIVNEKTGRPVEDFVERVLRDKQVIALANHTALVARDGHAVPIEDSAAPILDAAGSVLGVVLVFYDVMQKRRAQEALKESEERFRTLFNNMTEGFAVHEIITDESGRPCDYRFLDINPAFERLTGLKRADILGKRMYEVLPGNEPHWVEIYGRVALTGEPAHFENFSAPLKRWYEVLAFRSAPRQFAVIFMDVTERKQAEEKLAYLASFPEQNPNPVVEADLEGNVRYTNPAAQKLFPDLCELGPAHPWLADWAAVMASFEGTFSEGHTDTYVRDLTLGGCSYHQAFYYFTQERFIRIYAFDITKRTQAEEALRKLSRAVEQSPANVVITDAAGNIEYVNPKFTELTGYRFEEALGNNPRILKSGRTPAHVYKQLWDTIRAGGQWQGELCNQKKNGDLYWESVSISPITNEQGAITHFVAVKEDITERKQSEESLRVTIGALRESEARLMRAQQIAHLGSWELDLVKDRLSWSDEVYRIFGLQPQEFRATYEAFLEAVHPEDRATVDAAFSGSLREGKDSYEIEHRVVRKSNGEVRIVQEKCEHIRDESGAILRSTGMVHDITERKQAEQALQAYTEQLQRSNQALEDFASVASHDLQEPLRKIQAFGNMLKTRCSQGIDGDGRDYIDRIQQATTRMQSMLDGLLAYSRVTTQGRPFVTVDLGHVATEVLSDLEARLMRTGGRVELEDLPVIQADPLQMRQILQNLIGNALKFHRPGVPPQVKVSVQPISENRIVLSVEDNGAGFDERYASQLFKPFHRLHSKSEYEGTGMGLAICHKIIERHGGSISVTSRPGSGSSFSVTLPVQQKVE